MPMSEKLKRTIWAAVHTIELTLIPTYPQRFPTINDAKLYVQKICDAMNFDYGLRLNYNLRPTDPHHIVRMVKDRACFLVAVRAHDQGEFYLDEPLPDRQSLRGTDPPPFTHQSSSPSPSRPPSSTNSSTDAVESDIPRVLALFRIWPPSFASADVAAKYIAGVAALQKFEYTRFASVSEERFRAYVSWNTARRAWENRQFELTTVPREWRRKDSKASEKMGVKTMTDAIEADIARLSILIPSSSWPATFTDLNAARNFVGQWCYDNRFRYTGWPDVEIRKYRLFVNFNAAKYALEAGVFEVERAVPPLRGEMMRGGGGRDGGTERKEDVKALEFEAPGAEKADIAPVAGRADHTRQVEAEVSDSSDEYDTSKVRPWPTSSSSTESSGKSDEYDTSKFKPWTVTSSSSSDTPDAQDRPLPNAMAEVEKVDAAPVDPFKDLVSELQRGYILKTAFD